MKIRTSLVLAALFLVSALCALGQSTATLSGTVTDPSGAVVAAAQVKIHSLSTGADRLVVTDGAGLYVAPSLQPGDYTIQTTAAGFSAYTVQKVTLDLDQSVTVNMKLALSSAGETIQVESSAISTIEAQNITVGQVIDKTTVQEIPLNGRHFLDLTVLTPGGVTGPANGNLTAPSRGVGAFSFLTAGNRDDSVNFQINGINLNDINNAQIVFQPSINTTSEVKIDNSTASAEYGRNSGSITNVSTRSGSNAFHGEAFEYLRNQFFDARNFFNPKGTPQIVLKRHNFGGALGGPIWRDKTFAFGSYEALRQHQGLPVNTTVLTAAQAAGVTDPISLKLLQYIPAPNQGTNLYTGAINGPVNIDQGTIDILHIFSPKDTLHGFYAYQADLRTEPTTQGNTLPGFGDHRPGYRQILTVNDTHVFSPRLVNEFRAGYNRVNVTFIDNFNINPATLGYNNYPAGVQPDGGIPFTTIATTSIAIGGPSGFPSGRRDTLGVISDAATYTFGKHSIKFGGEGRRYLNANLGGDPGSVGFNTTPEIISPTGVIVQQSQSAVGNFQIGQATSFSITPQQTTSRIYANAVGAFAMDTFKVTQQLSLQYGFRFEWLGSPTFGNNQAAIFDPVTLTLNKYRTNGYNQPYSQNYNYMPRLGFIYDVFGNSKTILRGGYSILSDQPLSGLVTSLSSNPPFTTKVSYAATTTAGSSVTIGTTTYKNTSTNGTAANGICIQNASTCIPSLAQNSLYASASAAAVTISAVQPNYKNATTQSFNLNLQSELPGQFAVSVGYYGSVGRHLRSTQNINQINPSTLVRSFTALSANSPIDPGLAVTNLNQASSNGQSDYNGLWLNIRKNTNRGLTVNATYQYTKSLDLGSTAGASFVDITQPRLQYGLSDFDTRNRISGNAVYRLPFKGNRFVEGYQLAGIAQWQTGNPLNISTSTAFTGSVADRPLLLGHIPYAKQYTTNAVYWFAPIPNAAGTTNIPGNLVCAVSPTVAATPGCIFDAPTSYNTALGYPPLSAMMQRNGATGPGFADFDASFSKLTKVTEKVNFDLKIDVFDLFNHASFSNPGTTATAGSATFGVITATRFPVGDLGSSRQLQLSAKLSF
jgi:hypothetical protein